MPARSPRRASFHLCRLRAIHRSLTNAALLKLLQRVSTQHRYIHTRSDAHGPRLRSTDTVTWSCSAPTLTDSVGAVFLCPSRTMDKLNKLPPDIRKVSDKPEIFTRALKTLYFKPTLTNTSDDNIKSRAIERP